MAPVQGDYALRKPCHCGKPAYALGNFAFPEKFYLSGTVGEHSGANLAENKIHRGAPSTKDIVYISVLRRGSGVLEGYCTRFLSGIAFHIFVSQPIPSFGLNTCPEERTGCASTQRCPSAAGNENATACHYCVSHRKLVVKRFFFCFACHNIASMREGPKSS